MNLSEILTTCLKSGIEVRIRSDVQPHFYTEMIYCEGLPNALASKQAHSYTNLDSANFDYLTYALGKQLTVLLREVELHDASIRSNRG